MRGINATVLAMYRAQRFRNQNLNDLPQQLFACVTEHPFGGRV